MQLFKSYSTRYKQEVEICQLLAAGLLKQAKSYTDDYFDEKGSYEIIAHKEDDGVLKARIRSRHTSNKHITCGLNTLKG